MARLFILRHGKTEIHASTGRDFDRALVARGIENSRTMGALMAGSMPAPEAVLVSPAMRAHQTAEFVLAAMQKAGGKPLPAPIYDERIYGAAAPHLAGIIAEHAGECATALIIGHNPGLVLLAEMMLAEAHRGIGHLPTCGLVDIGFEPPRLSGMTPGEGELHGFYTPKALKGKA